MKEKIRKREDGMKENKGEKNEGWLWLRLMMCVEKSKLGWDWWRIIEIASDGIRGMTQSYSGFSERGFSEVDI